MFGMKKIDLKYMNVGNKSCVRFSNTGLIVMIYSLFRLGGQVSSVNG